MENGQDRDTVQIHFQCMEEENVLGLEKKEDLADLCHPVLVSLLFSKNKILLLPPSLNLFYHVNTVIVQNQDALEFGFQTITHTTSKIVALSYTI